MIGALVLAAGRSERMGTQKLLLPLGDKPVITHVVDELLASRVDKILIVVGCHGEQIRETLTGKAVQFLENPDPASDMSGSLRRGLRAIIDCEAVLVVLGDQPGITRGLVDELIHSFHQCGTKIVVPSCSGHRGHPVLIGSRYFDEVLRNHTDTGLRGFLNAHAEEVTNVAVADVTAMEDMDTPPDYQRQKRLFATRSGRHGLASVTNQV
jgi:molybdenum cofactor cytidylyltransferase